MVLGASDSSRSSHLKRQISSRQACRHNKPASAGHTDLEPLPILRPGRFPGLRPRANRGANVLTCLECPFVEGSNDLWPCAMSATIVGAILPGYCHAYQHSAPQERWRTRCLPDWGSLERYAQAQEQAQAQRSAHVSHSWEPELEAGPTSEKEWPGARLHHQRSCVVTRRHRQSWELGTEQQLSAVSRELRGGG